MPGPGQWQSQGVEGEFKKSPWPHRTSVGHFSLWPCHQANTTGEGFPFDSQASAAEEGEALLFIALGPGGKGEGGWPELLLCPALLFINSSPSGLMLPDSTPRPRLWQ